MLSVPPPTRVALGTLEIGGQKVELFVSTEWARYFQSLNSEVLASSGTVAESAQHTASLSEGGDTADFSPSPPGPSGAKGEMGPALFLLQDDGGEQAMLMPPSIDGVYVPLNTKDASGGVPGLTLFNLNLKNVAGTITSWFTTAATVARTWTMPDKDGTVAVLSDFAAPPAIGNTTPAAGRFTSLTSTAGFGCNGSAAQGPVASGGTLAGVIAALVANGILSS
jgi:hypothetical protein